MSGFWYDPLIHGVESGPATTLGETPSATAWPGGTTLGATLATSTYSTGVSLGDTPNSTEWPPTGGASPIDLFGQDDESGATARAITANYKAASPFALPEAADIVNMYAYLDGGGVGSGTQVFKGVIYADSSGSPGALLATSIEATVSDTQPAGWVELSFAATVELDVGTYWLGILIGPTNGVARYYTVAGGSEKWNADTYSGGASNPFGTPDGTEAWTDCIYATYIPSAVAPTMLFEDGFENENHALWNGGIGGRNASCDCIATCPGGTPDTGDPLDSYEPYGTGSAYRVVSRVDCRAPTASCHSGCELVHDWGIANGLRLGLTDFYALRARINSPYLAQTEFCSILSCSYPQIRGSVCGIQIYNQVYIISMNAGYNTTAGYNNANGYYTRAVGIPAPNTAAGNFGVAPHDIRVDEWRDWIVEMKHCTIYGQAGGSSAGTNPVTGAAISFPYQGYMLVKTRIPGDTSAWTTLWDTRTSSCATAAAAPNGCPTAQWGYGANTPPGTYRYEVDHNGINVANPSPHAGYIFGDPRRQSNKTGVYRANPNVTGYAGHNNNTLSVDRRFAIASSFADAEDWLEQLT